MNTPFQGISVYQGAVALGLLLAAASATALTSPLPARNATPAAQTAPTPNTLTPTAPATFPTSPVGEDVRDNRRPRQLLQPWLWAATAAGVLGLFAAAHAAWRWLHHGKFFVLPPHEIALQGLEEARRLMNPDHAREYCSEVSRVLHRYLEQQFQLHSPQLTTEEFLRELVKVRETLPASQRAALGGFVQHCEFAKFAGWRCCRPDLEALHASAVGFVRRTAAPGLPLITTT